MDAACQKEADSWNIKAHLNVKLSSAKRKIMNSNVDIHNMNPCKRIEGEQELEVAQQLQSK